MTFVSATVTEPASANHTEEAEGSPVAIVLKAWLQRQRTQRGKLLGRNVWRCRGKAESLHQKSNLVEVSWDKHGRLVRQVVHVYNGANHTNGNHFSCVVKLSVKGLSKCP